MKGGDEEAEGGNNNEPNKKRKKGGKEANPSALSESYTCSQEVLQSIDAAYRCRQIMQRQRDIVHKRDPTKKKPKKTQPNMRMLS